MSAASVLVNADVVNVQRLDIFQQQVVLDLRHLAECVTQHATVIIHEYGLAAVVEHGFQFLLVILGGVRLEQIWA